MHLLRTNAISVEIRVITLYYARIHIKEGDSTFYKMLSVSIVSKQGITRLIVLLFNRTNKFNNNRVRRRKLNDL